MSTTTPPPCGGQQPPQEAASQQLQAMLQAAVQSVQWTYCIFWQFCPHRRILVWCDGYYNGAIKTRKTVQPMEVTAEEASLQRSQQLKELYESLLSTAAKRPCAALSPEDLTETEWFYLMCVSFSFPPGHGLPGKAYAKRQHVWLCGANEVDSKIYSRAILAKSARVQTVLCIPLLDGVLELGTTTKVQEDIGVVERVKGFFTDQNYQHNPAPKPALSGHSTSDPAPSSDHPSSAFRSPLFPPAVFSPEDTPTGNPDDDDDEEDEPDDLEIDDNDEDEDEEQLDDQCDNSDSEAEPHSTPAAESQPTELMQLDMSEDIRLGSPDDGSNQIDSANFHLIGSSDDLRAAGPPGSDSTTQRWRSLMMEADCCVELQPPQPMEELSQEDSHYSQTVSAVLQNHRVGWSGGWPTTTSTAYSSPHSAFATWTNYAASSAAESGTSQWALKYVLFNVPYLHAKHREEENSPKSRDAGGGGRLRDELSANHVLAERRRREKLNERFIVLRSLVPFVTKMDKASILGDTIEYLKQMRKKIQELEAKNRQMEAAAVAEQQPRLVPANNNCTIQRSASSTGLREQRSSASATVVARSEKKKTTRAAKAVEASVEVSIIERDALLELECEHREGLLLDMMQKLREMRIEITSVQTSLSNGVLVAELRAKVKENPVGKKVSIVEVKRAIHEIIPS